MSAVVVDENTAEGTSNGEVLDQAAGGVDTGVPSATCALDVKGCCRFRRWSDRS